MIPSQKLKFPVYQQAAGRDIANALRILTDVSSLIDVSGEDAAGLERYISQIKRKFERSLMQAIKLVEEKP